MNTDREMTEIDTPAWMTQLFKAIDALNFSTDGGFQPLLTTS